MEDLALEPNARYLRTLASELVRKTAPSRETCNSALSDHDLRDVVVHLERTMNAAAAAQAAALAEMGRRARLHDSARAIGDAPPLDPQVSVLVSEEFVPDEVALLLHCSTVAAHTRFRTALDAADIPAVFDHWQAGVIDAAKVRVITEELAPLKARALSTHDLAVDAVDYAVSHTPTQTRAWLARRIVAIDERCRRATAERRVVLTPGADSMASIWAHLPGVQARQIFDTVDAVARAAGSDDARTMDQRRADALIDLVTGRAEPPRVDVQVVVSAETLAGTSESAAWVPAVGPISASQARDCAAGDNAVWRRLLTDPDTGSLVELSERQYRPSRRLDRSVRSRDVTCRFPGCRRAATGSSDLDHTVPWPAGPTAATNLAALCRRHHRLKHSPGWSVQQDTHGVLEWTTPDGRRFTTEPWRYDDPRGP
ncbi:MAG: hypothetical protein ABI720_01080 [Actinomycetes bacterium]